MVGHPPHPTGADVTGCEALVERLEGGEPLPGMTLAESIAHLASLALAGGWRSDGERHRARALFLRLAALGWAADPPGGGPPLTAPPRRSGSRTSRPRPACRSGWRPGRC